MLKEGHTAESIVATLNPNMKQSDIEFLKRNGGGSLKGKEAFAFGQLHGKRRLLDFQRIRMPKRSQQGSWIKTES